MKLTNKERNAIQRILSFEVEEQDEHTTIFAGDAPYSCTSTIIQSEDGRSSSQEKLNLIEVEIPGPQVKKKGKSYDVVEDYDDVDGRKRDKAKKVLKICLRGSKVVLAIACDVGRSVNEAIVPKPIDTIVQALIDSIQKHVLKKDQQATPDVVQVIDLDIDEQLQSTLDQLRAKGYTIKDAQEVAKAIEEIDQHPRTELSVHSAASCANIEYTKF